MRKRAEDRTMKLYSYVVTHDTGFSPNPFWGYCTLADCKPKIRKTADVGDWIIGLSPRDKGRGNKVIFAMLVDEILPYEQYYRDERFARKIPDYSKGPVVCKCGDNIYEPLPNGDFRQLPSTHSNGPAENPKTKADDLGGANVLIAEVFHYFGQRAISLPEGLEELKVGRGHKCRFSPEVIRTFLKFFGRRKAGVIARPTRWAKHDDSWKMD